MLRRVCTYASTITFHLVSTVLVLALLFVLVTQTWKLVATTWPGAKQREVGESLSTGVIGQATAADLPTSGVTIARKPMSQPQAAGASGPINAVVPPTNTKPVAEAPTPPGDPKDAIANTMTAVATAVGVIALILAIGTSWFATKQKELGDLITRQSKEFEDKERVLDEIIALQARRTHLAVLLSQAKRAAYVWVSANSESDAKAMMAAEIAANLEFLLSEDVGIRKLAFDRLTTYPWADDEPNLAPVRQYTEACHLFHGRGRVAEMALTQTGLWCRIFWEEERKQFKKARDNPENTAASPISS